MPPWALDAPINFMYVEDSDSDVVTGSDVENEAAVDAGDEWSGLLDSDSDSDSDNENDNENGNENDNNIDSPPNNY